MNYMLLFLLICVVAGLWGPRNKANMRKLVALLAVALVLLFWLSPHRM